MLDSECSHSCCPFILSCAAPFPLLHSTCSSLNLSVQISVFLLLCFFLFFPFWLNLSRSVFSTPPLFLPCPAPFSSHPLREVRKGASVLGEMLFCGWWELWGGGTLIISEEEGGRKGMLCGKGMKGRMGTV